AAEDGGLDVVMEEAGAVAVVSVDVGIRRRGGRYVAGGVGTGGGGSGGGAREITGEMPSSSMLPPTSGISNRVLGWVRTGGGGRRPLGWGDPLTSTSGGNALSSGAEVRRRRGGGGGRG